MLRIYAPMVAVVAVLTATAANAASVAGTITAIDDVKHTVTLDDGMVYTATATMNLTRLQVGYVIKMNYSKEDGANKVTTLEIISPAQPSGY